MEKIEWKRSLLTDSGIKVKSKSPIIGGFRGQSSEVKLKSPSIGELEAQNNMKQKPRIRGTTPEIEQAAKRLRQNLTPAEARLWSAIRNKQLARLRFRCQHPVGNFILDFYCPAHKLVIEIDGAIHNSQVEYDGERTSKLAEYGYTVLRFSNEQVVNNLPQVLAEIEGAVCPEAKRIL